MAPTISPSDGTSSPLGLPTAFIPVVVENTNVNAFLDTGSDVSIISEEMRMKIPLLKQKPLSKLYHHTLSVTGQSMDTLGQISVSLRIGTSTVFHTFQVIRGITKPFLLGWDFFCAHSMNIDVGNGTVSFHNQTIPLMHLSRDAPTCCHVQVSSPVTIPPMSELNATVSLVSPITGYCPDGYLGVFEPEANMRYINTL